MNTYLLYEYLMIKWLLKVPADFVEEVNLCSNYSQTTLLHMWLLA